MDPAAALRHLSSQHGGVFTRRQALEVGFTKAQIEPALRAGRWCTLRYGVHVVAENLPEPGSMAAAALSVAAARLTVGPDLVAYGRTAAVLHGLPLLGPAPAQPQLVVRRTQGAGPRGNVRGCRTGRWCSGWACP